ncbi:hypothetical protein [Hyalangium minutum]|uniref:Uncharacterized protein n=1 Tax=Hyalangium minutum TaxID=394096 RepID=A0A085WSL3_9BACT|nr:hypothetical protein [Hyalangium minutum]KFE70676.1 hypothetical protein DB31_5718 [Hyalangium minutum]
MAGQGWISSARYDGFFFFGTALLAVLAGVLVLAAPVLVVPVWWLWLGLVDGPHFAATWVRTYLDPHERRARARLLAGSLVFWLPGILALGLNELLGSPAPFEAFLGLSALWAIHHAVRQHFGIMSIYQRLSGATEQARKQDWAFLHGTLWLMFVVYLLVFPVNRTILGLAAEAGPQEQWAVRALAATSVAAVLGYSGLLALRWRRGEAIRPGLYALVVAVGTAAFGYFVVGAFEPLVPSPSNTEQLSFAVVAVSGSLHGLQYLGIIFATGRRRYGASTERSLVARLGRAPLLTYGALVAVSFFYLLVNACRGVAPDVAFFPFDSNAARFFLALYWGGALHHYYLDQKIWHPRRDPVLRRELGMADASP